MFNQIVVIVSVLIVKTKHFARNVLSDIALKMANVSVIKLDLKTPNQSVLTLTVIIVQLDLAENVSQDISSTKMENVMSVLFKTVPPAQEMNALFVNPLLLFL